VAFGDLAAGVQLEHLEALGALQPGHLAGHLQLLDRLGELRRAGERPPLLEVGVGAWDSNTSSSALTEEPTLQQARSLGRVAWNVGESLTGLHLGEYEVKELLGEGGMSDVYAGVAARIGKRVAIKVLKPEMAADKTHVARLMTEAVAVNTIGHRNVIDIFGSGTLPDGRPYIVMEFLEGESLDTYLDRVPILPQLEAVEILIDILGPLQARTPRHHSPRPQAVERVPAAAARRHPLLEAARLRSGEALDGDGRPDQADQPVPGGRHPRLHGARAGARAGGRPRHRPLRGGRARLPAAERPAALRRPHPGGVFTGSQRSRRVGPTKGSRPLSSW